MKPSKSPKTRSRRLPRIVIALPDEEHAKELSEALHRAGFLPHRAPSPETASLAVNYRNPAVILLDASFIESAGFRYFDSLRALAPEVPLLVVAPADQQDLRVRCLSMGAEDCLVRPFAVQEVVLRVRRILERRAALNALTAEKEEAEERAGRDRSDLGVLRAQNRRSAELLQRAVDFHQRLDPQGDEETLYAHFLRHLSVQIGVSRLALLVPSHGEGSWLVTRGSWGLPQRLTERLRVPGRGELVSLLEATAAPLVLARTGSLPGLRVERGLFAAGGFTTCLPLLFKGELRALVLLGESRTGGAPDDELLRLAQFLASSFVPTLAAQSRWTGDRHVSAETLGFLVDSLEARNPYLHGHSLRVAGMVEELGTHLGMRGLELSRLTTAALLHDIGRFEVDAGFWSKAGPLAPEDWTIIRQHPEDGARILGAASWDQTIVESVRHHHERWDGTGYPDGLREAEIPWHARIIAVADALESLTGGRPGRPPLPRDEAVRQLAREAGTAFDPRLVELLEHLYLDQDLPMETAGSQG